MDKLTQAYTVGGVITAAGGPIYAINPMVGGGISILGLLIVWYGVRRSRDEGNDSDTTPSVQEVHVDPDVWAREYWDDKGRRYVILRSVHVGNNNTAGIAVKVRLRLTNKESGNYCELDPRPEPPNGYEPRRDWLGESVSLEGRPDFKEGDLGYHLNIIDQDALGITEESQGVKAIQGELIVEDLTTGDSQKLTLDRTLALNLEDVRP